MYRRSLRSIKICIADMAAFNPSMKEELCLFCSQPHLQCLDQCLAQTIRQNKCQQTLIASSCILVGMEGCDTRDRKKPGWIGPVSPFCLREPCVNFIGLNSIKPCYQYLVILSEWVFHIRNPFICWLFAFWRRGDAYEACEANWSVQGEANAVEFNPKWYQEENLRWLRV